MLFVRWDRRMKKFVVLNNALLGLYPMLASKLFQCLKLLNLWHSRVTLYDPNPAGFLTHQALTNRVQRQTAS